MTRTAKLGIAFAIVVGSTTASHAEAPRLGVWKNTVKARGPAAQRGSLAPVSRVLYLNDCKNNRCAVTPGNDDSRTNRTSIAANAVTLPAWPYGDTVWNALVDCVKDTYAQFNIQVVTADPGSNTNHFEVMIGGRATQLNPELQGAAGVAPFVDCSTTEDNIISFVFAEEASNLNFLCHAVAQESAHVWGLDHAMDADDPMTYLEFGTLKRFQNNDAPCGEFDARSCFCGGNTQNSVRFLNNAFGPANLGPASVSITQPVEGQWVKPGFTVRAELDSQLDFASGELQIDGQTTQMINGDEIVFTAPTMMTAGPHTVQIAATDAADRTVTDSVNVKVLGSCSAAAPCPSSFHCLGGLCYPNANEPGGFGATCTSNDSCITGQCGDDGTNKLCTAACDPGGVCPAGFDCIGSGASGVCWPSDDTGGCASGSASSGMILIFGGLGAPVLARRRRRT